MSLKEKNIEKRYYTIGEVAKILDVATSQIRFWENEFDLIKPQKSKSGKRQFTKEDIENVKLIYHLVKTKGYTLQGAKNFLKNNAKAARDKMEMIENLQKVRSFLVEIHNSLD